jgi:hypothetical protein
MEKYYFQYGGSHKLYNEFINELRLTYNNIKYYTDNLTITGSAAIAILLNHLNMTSDLYSYKMPVVVDFLYVNDVISHPNIANFIKSTDNLVKIVNYKRNDDEDTYKINSFNLIYIPLKESIYNIFISHLYILHPESLLEYYQNKENCQYEINLLNKILSIIKNKNDKYINGFEYVKFNNNSEIIDPDNNINSDTSSFKEPVTNIKSTSLSIQPLNNLKQSGGFTNDFYKYKYFKYKMRYLSLKKKIS